jgi:Tol biopolymer transport system component
VWSPDSKRLACESFGDTDPSRNGIYTIRSSDGAGLTRMTSNPGGDDLPGDYSPQGKRFVFARFDQNGKVAALPQPTRARQASGSQGSTRQVEAADVVAHPPQHGGGRGRVQRLVAELVGRDQENPHTARVAL